jgi:hypothetical protein
MALTTLLPTPDGNPSLTVQRQAYRSARLWPENEILEPAPKRRRARMESDAAKDYKGDDTKLSEPFRPREKRNRRRSGLLNVAADRPEAV